MNDKPLPADHSSPSAAKGAWAAPSVEELDFSSTEGNFNTNGTDGPYTS